MSKINGEKARAAIQQKRRVAAREKAQAKLAELKAAAKGGDDAKK